MAVLGGWGGEGRGAADGGNRMDGGDEFGGAFEVGGLTGEDDYRSTEIMGVFEEPMLAGEGAVGHEEDAGGSILET